MLFFIILSILISVIDVYVQFQSGFIFRGMVVLTRSRVQDRYLRSFFFFDGCLIILLVAGLISREYNLNYPILVLSIVRFARMFEMDEFYMRSLSTHRLAKTLYVIGKQFITIYVLSHSIAIPFYLVDEAQLNTVCGTASTSGRTTANT